MRDHLMTEADTCRELVTPRLVEAVWGAAPHVPGEQRSFTNGRIIAAGGKVRRGKRDRADYLLYYRRDYPQAIVETKEIGLPAETGVQQAREYAEILGLKFGYAINGNRTIEIDYTSGTEREVDRYATPDELFARLAAAAQFLQEAASRLLEPLNLSTVRAGDFTYPKLMAWEDALGVVPAACYGMVVSPEFPVFGINTDEVLPEVLDIYFRTPEVWPALAELSGGTNIRRRRLQPSAFLRYQIQVPLKAAQLKVREAFRRTHAPKTEHAAIRQTNAAPLPATLERVFAGNP